MPQDGAQHRFGNPLGPQEVYAPGGMPVRGGVLRVGEFFVIKIVQQAHEAPGLRVFAELGGIGAHRGLDREHVLPQRRGLRVVLHQGQGFVTIHDRSTPHRSLQSASMSCGHNRRA